MKSSEHSTEILGSLVAKYGEAEIRQDGPWRCLYNRGKLWVVDVEEEWYEKYLYPHLDPSMAVLEFGLGMGVSSHGICKRARRLVTVEKEQDIIGLYQKWIGIPIGRREELYPYTLLPDKPTKKQELIWADQFDFPKCKDGAYIHYDGSFDLVFIDTWTAVNKEAVSIAKRLTEKLRMLNLVKPEGKIIPWFGDYMDKFLECGENYKEFRKVVPS